MNLQKSKIQLDRKLQSEIMKKIKSLVMETNPEPKEADDPVCPHCHSNELVGNGNYRNRKRFICKKCGRSFNNLTGTVCSYIQDKEKFIRYAESMLSGKSLRKLSAETNVSLNTALNWKHKILDMIS